jgi:hypothetical protein
MKHKIKRKKVNFDPKIREARAVHYDEQGLIISPTEYQLLRMLRRSEKDFKQGRYTRVTCVADLFK